jgi:hypothetical protein
MANDFLVFNPNGNNELTQPNYVANATRANGLVTGVAIKELHNKLFKQTSMMAAALGTLLDENGLTATDSNFTALKNALKTAMLSMDRILEPVANLAALKAINTTLLPQGVNINCSTLGNFYLDVNSTLTPDDVTIVQPTVGIGRWLISGANTFENRIYNFSMERLNKDANDIFIEIRTKRPDGTLYYKSVLSGGTSPKYTTRTSTYYAVDGITATNVKVFTLNYTGDDLTSEVLV